MNKLLTITAALLLAACATKPTDDQAQLITRACNADGIARPLATITVAGSMPQNLPKLQALQKSIDAICANPAAPDATMAGLRTLTTQAADLLAAAQARKAAEAAPAASAPR